MVAPLTFWPLRATVAVVVSAFIGQIIQIPLAVLLDLIWRNEVTGGRWPLNLPNIILTCVTALLVGFSTGWIAGRRGKLLAAIAIFVPLWVMIALAIIKNVDSTEYLAQTYDTKPALWVWIGLAPAILGGHFGAIDGKKYFNRAARYCGMGFMYLAYIGFLLFHLYTTYVAFDLAGFFAAAISFGLPILAELYWVWFIWNTSGVFLTHYSALLLMHVAFLVFGVLTLFLAEKTKDRSHDVVVRSIDDPINL